MPRILTAKRGFTALGGVRLRVPLPADRGDGAVRLQQAVARRARRRSTGPTSATSRRRSSGTSRCGTASPPAGSRSVCTTRRTSRRSRPAPRSRPPRRSSRPCSDSAPLSRWRACTRSLRVPFDALVYMTLVVPEIVIAVASLIFFVQLPRYVPFFPPLGAVDDLLRAGGLRRLAGDADHPGAVRRHGRHPRGGRLRPRLGPALHVPAGHAAAAVPGDHRGGAAVVHVLLRRLRPAGVHQRHHQHLADRALLGGPVRDHAGRQRAGDADAGGDHRASIAVTGLVSRRSRTRQDRRPRGRGRRAPSWVSAEPWSVRDPRSTVRAAGDSFVSAGPEQGDVR